MSRSSPPPAATVESAWRGKAQTLQWLAPRLRCSEVPIGVRVEVTRWRKAKRTCVRELQRQFGVGQVAVRSDRGHEDGEQQSHAGMYLSRLDVPINDAKLLGEAIDAVIASYGEPRADDAVFVQVMVRARLAVVAATRAVEDGAAYFTFSLAEGSRTDAVTRGDVPVRTVYVAPEAPRPEEPDLARLHRAVSELQILCGDQPLEAELVLRDDRVVLLQVRPLLGMHPFVPNAVARRRALTRELAQLRHDDTARSCLGPRRALALMPDWNPAELLGQHPRPLALSIFERVLGRRAWHVARAALGYRRLRSAKLLLAVAGRPYVDVRASANSLLPRALDPGSVGRIVEAWQQRLLEQPQLHDKYEFHIAQTCVDFTFEQDWQERYADVLDAAALHRFHVAARVVTRRCLAVAPMEAARRRLVRLERRLAHPPTHETTATLLSQIERDGGVAFALVARLAFVFESLLRSAVQRGALTAERLLALQRSCTTVAREFVDNLAEDARGRHAFLRAGTFEITTPHLGQLAPLRSLRASPHTPAFESTGVEQRALAQLLREAELGITPAQLLRGYVRTRQAREHGKYVLSAAVSYLLEHLATRAQAAGVDRDTLSWLALPACLGPLSAADIASAAERARAQHVQDGLLRLPIVLDLAQPLHQVSIAAGTPTFIGHTRTSAPVIKVDMRTEPAAVAPDAILAIASADPGFDWIFTRAPAGLITAFGGPNSHMAIRCAELGIPAVLGLGQERWRRLSEAAYLDIDTVSQSLAPCLPTGRHGSS